MFIDDTGFVFAGLVPHPPVLVPQVGRGRERMAGQTLSALRSLTSRLMESRPDLLVLLSPHSPRRPGAFGYWPGPRVWGDFSRFNARDCAIDLPVAEEFLRSLCERASPLGLMLWPIRERELDHGATVPLHFFVEAGWSGPVAILGLDYPGEGDFGPLGYLLAETARNSGRRVAIIASGDMSHRLTESAPSGYHPDGAVFDQKFVDLLRNHELRAIPSISPQLAEAAGQDVLESTVITLAALGYRHDSTEVLSYEGPFGVGYCVAVLHQPYSGVQGGGGELLPAIARTTVEAVAQGRMITPPAVPAIGYLARRGGMFITLRRRDGTVRGCLGTIHATQENLVLETVERAAAVAEFAYGTRVEAHELPELLYEVSVLHEPEPVDSPGLLDPAIYGVIIRNDAGRRAVLLPGIESIQTVDEQLNIARKKAGIRADESVSLERFRTDHFIENHIWQPHDEQSHEQRL